MAKGKHLLIDCRNVPEHICLDDARMLRVLSRAAEKAGATVLSQVRYHLGYNSPPGFAVIVLLDESHCSAHSYADLGLLAVDIFTCGETNPKLVFQYVKDELGLEEFTLQYLNRFEEDTPVVGEDAQSIPAHAVLDTPLEGNDSKWQMATVTGGDHTGKSVCILVKFSDGWCICDMGDGDPLGKFRIENLRLWSPVNRVSVNKS